MLRTFPNDVVISEHPAWQAEKKVWFSSSKQTGEKRTVSQEQFALQNELGLSLQRKIQILKQTKFYEVLLA